MKILNAVLKIIVILQHFNQLFIEHLLNFAFLIHQINNNNILVILLHFVEMRVETFFGLLFGFDNVDGLVGHASLYPK